MAARAMPRCQAPGQVQRGQSVRRKRATCGDTAFQDTAACLAPGQVRKAQRLEKLQGLGDGRYPGARPVLQLGPRRLLARTVDEDYPHPDPLGTRELVVRAVADEERFRRLDVQLLEHELVDPGIGLAEAAGGGEDLCVEEPGERRLGQTSTVSSLQT